MVTIKTQLDQSIHRQTDTLNSIFPADLDIIRICNKIINWYSLIPKLTPLIDLFVVWLVVTINMVSYNFCVFFAHQNDCFCRPDTISKPPRIYPANSVASHQNVHMRWCSPWLFEYALNYIQIFTCSRMDRPCDDKGNLPYEKNNLIILLGSC